MATLTDEILDLHDRFIGSLFNKAKRKHDDAFQASGKAINEKVRLYARIGQVLLAAKRDGDDPFAAIEQILPWEDFAQSVSEAERLARPRRFRFPWTHHGRLFSGAPLCANAMAPKEWLS
jgi:hypothetical protein